MADDARVPSMGAAAGGAVPAPRRAAVMLLRDVTLWQAALWPEAFATGSARLGAALGVALPPPGRSAPGAQGRLIRVQPLVWHLLDAPAEDDGGPPPAFRALAPEEGAVTELGPGLARLSVRGPAAAALLARAVSLDLRPAAFPPGAVAATGWRRAAVTLVRLESGGYDLLAPLSYAEDLADGLSRQALQFG